MRAARPMKSLSDDTMQKPSTQRAWISSMASMMSAESLEFLPLRQRNCWCGRMASVWSTRFHRVSCGVLTLTLTLPKKQTKGGAKRLAIE